MYSSKTITTALTFGLLFATASFGQPTYTYTVVPPPTDFKITAPLIPTPSPAGDPAPASQIRQIVYGMRWISDDGKRGVGTGVIAGDQGALLTVCFTYQNGAYTVVSTPSVNCAVNAGSSNGDFVGTLQVAGDPSTHAFLYHGGGFTLFDNLLPQVFEHPDPIVRSTAVTINANGQVLGSTFTSQTAFNPFVGPNTGAFLSYSWLYSNGAITRVADLGGPYNGATGLNDNGDIAGFSAPPDPTHNYYHATLNPGGGAAIDLTGGAHRTYSMASLVNSRGQIVGTTSLPTDSASHPLNHPFFYDGSMTIMIPDATGGAVSLNDSGAAIGFYALVSDANTIHQFYYQNGQVSELNSLVANLPAGTTLGPRQITNQGVILAVATSDSDPNAEPATVLLTPQPPAGQ